MSFGKITVITPPDKLFNATISYLLVKPSLQVKQQFQSFLSNSIDDLNIFIFDDDEQDIDWLLSIAHQADSIIIDIDNCDPITKSFVTLLLTQPNVYYMTTDETTPYNLISKNRIYDLDWMSEEIDDNYNEDEDESEE